MYIFCTLICEQLEKVNTMERPIKITHSENSLVCVGLLKDTLAYYNSLKRFHGGSMELSKLLKNDSPYILKKKKKKNQHSFIMYSKQID